MVVVKTTTTNATRPSPRRSNRLRKGKQRATSFSPIASTSRLSAKTIPGGYNTSHYDTPQWQDAPDRDHSADHDSEQCFEADHFYNRRRSGGDDDGGDDGGNDGGDDGGDDDGNDGDHGDHGDHGDGGDGGGDSGDDGNADTDEYSVADNHPLPPAPSNSPNLVFDDPPHVAPSASPNPQPTWQEAMTYLAGINQRGQSAPPNAHRPRTKAREPEPFSGANPDDLHKFLFQCRLYFRANPTQFESGTMKVNFAMTYLTDVALRWFETGIDQEELHGTIFPWTTDWDEFVKELKTHFGVADIKGEAAELLENLSMNSRDKLTTYNVEFMRLSSELTWGDDTLCYRFYKGLPDRLKDQISEMPAGKPKTLVLMREAALSFDNRYWERQRERARSRGVTDTSSAPGQRKPGTPQTPQSSTHPPKPSSGSSNTPKPISKPPTSGPSSGPSKFSSTKPDLSDKLGKDGKLTNEERQRRLDGNLCLFCGIAGHSVSDCRKKQAAATKASARLADTTVKSSPPSSGK
jgi:hypothetical protein